MEAIDYHYITDEDMKKLLDAEWNKAIEVVVSKIYPLNRNSHMDKVYIGRLKKELLALKR